MEAEIKEENVAGPGIDLDENADVSRQSVLVVDDEPDTLFLLKQIMRIAGFNVAGAGSGREALQKMEMHKPDLVLLDLMMPEMNGWETYKAMQKINDTPVIIVSALGTKEEVVSGLRYGADDYIPKPFYNAEVVERVRAVMRRAGDTKEESELNFPEVGLSVELITKKVILEGKDVLLTPKEFAVLATLAKRAPVIVSYETIAEDVWGMDSDSVRKRMKYLIYLLRRKFERVAPEKKLILNVDRLGYKLRTEE
jgi:DNA-binding response OmpR family regulator